MDVDVWVRGQQEARTQPIEGIPEALPSSWVMNQRYVHAVMAAGGVPVLVPLLAEDPAIAATKASKARKLWAVCGLPDFRKVGPMHHARMVRRLFSYIGEG